MLKKLGLILPALLLASALAFLGCGDNANGDNYANKTWKEVTLTRTGNELGNGLSYKTNSATVNHAQKTISIPEPEDDWRGLDVLQGNDTIPSTGLKAGDVVEVIISAFAAEIEIHVCNASEDFGSFGKGKTTDANTPIIITAVVTGNIGPGDFDNASVVRIRNNKGNKNAFVVHSIRIYSAHELP